MNRTLLDKNFKGVFLLFIGKKNKYKKYWIIIVSMIKFIYNKGGIFDVKKT